MYMSLCQQASLAQAVKGQTGYFLLVILPSPPFSVCFGCFVSANSHACFLCLPLFRRVRLCTWEACSIIMFFQLTCLDTVANNFRFVSANACWFPFIIDWFPWRIRHMMMSCIAWWNFVDSLRLLSVLLVLSFCTLLQRQIRPLSTCSALSHIPTAICMVPLAGHLFCTKWQPSMPSTLWVWQATMQCCTRYSMLLQGGCCSLVWKWDLLKEWLLHKAGQRMLLARRSKIPVSKCNSKLARWGAVKVIPPRWGIVFILVMVLQWSMTSMTVFAC